MKLRRTKTMHEDSLGLKRRRLPLQNVLRVMTKEEV
jgi:hypothetical protein